MSHVPTSTLLRPERDYLWWAVLLSALLHLAGAWWWSSTRSPTTPATPTMDVALLNFKTETPPLQADLLAQWQADGGGDASNALASSPTHAADMPSPDQLVLMALQKRRLQLEQEQQQLLSQLESDWAVQQQSNGVEQSPTDPVEHGENPQAHTPSPEQSLHALRAAVQAYNQQPRYIFEGPSAHQSPIATYVETWRHQIETLGTELYPEPARGQRSDTVQLTVYIRSDGSLERVMIHRPASDPLFTLTAQRILNLAAPFAPFSSELAEYGDVLAITRTWHFHQYQLRTQTP